MHLDITVKQKSHGKFVGWQTDGNERFLLGNFTVTHNSRLLGGKDHSSARYIFTQLSDILKYIIRKEDNGILEYLDDDGFKIEPKMYYPIVPLILVNGADGIGTGFSTFIPNYNIKSIIEILLAKLNNDKHDKLIPYYNKHLNTIHKIDHDTYLSLGMIKIEDNKVHITELPVKAWTSKYKAFLEELIYDKEDQLFQNFTNQSSDKSVLFILKPKDINTIEKMIKSSDKNGFTELHKYLKLYDTFKISNMHAFDQNSNIKKYFTAEKIIDTFYDIRLTKYGERKQLLLKQLKEELMYQENKLQWLFLIIHKKIDLLKYNNDQLIKLLNSKKFVVKNDSYDYLLNIAVRNMTKENMDILKQKINDIKHDIDKLTKLTPVKIWINELIELKAHLTKQIHT